MDLQNKIARAIHGNVAKVIVGKDEQIITVLATWLAGGHVLLEDVPGTGKTMMVRAFSKSVDVPFTRVQFTPDLLPSDLTGHSFYDESNKRFVFRKGPLFTTLFLGDELNRATPRAQSALLEAMAERQITAEGITAGLPPLFFVIATQNPIEQQGTFPLPEAALDRFWVRLALGPPDRDNEMKMLLSRTAADPLEQIDKIVSSKELESVQQEIGRIQVAPALAQYLIGLLTMLRKHPKLALGPSPRSGLQLLRLSMVWAYLAGEDFVRPEFVYELAPVVLGHRLMLRPEARFEGIQNEEIIDECLKKVRATAR
ncbi:MAG: MoxR family ATPase [Bdellovibrio sp.]|nr:MoxR family ATPase [Bdellovibrio sp.]